MTDLEMAMVPETEMDPEKDQVLEMECPRDLAKDPALVLMMDIPEEAMDLATDPVKAAAATRRDTRGLVLEMDPDLAKAVERALVRMMDPVLVPRDIRAAVDMEIVMEMEAVPRDIRALAQEMETATDLALNLDLTMDTLAVEMVVDQAAMIMPPQHQLPNLSTHQLQLPWLMPLQLPY